MDVGLRAAPLRVVAEARRHERGREVVVVAYVDRLAVQLGASSARGAKGLAPPGVVDDAREAAAGVLDRHAHAPGRKAVEVVRGPVERIDYPAASTRAALAGALLGHERVVGPLTAPAARRSPPRPPLSASETMSVEEDLTATPRAGPPKRSIRRSPASRAARSAQLEVRGQKIARRTTTRTVIAADHDERPQEELKSLPFGTERIEHAGT